MKHLLTIALVILGTQAQAQMPGAPVLHTFGCQSKLMGVGHKLECLTSGSVAPQYSLQSCSLLNTVIYPGAPVEETVLNIESQNIRTAILSDTNGFYRVKLDKRKMSAQVKMGNQKMICTKQVSSGPIGGGFSVGNK